MTDSRVDQAETILPRVARARPYQVPAARFLKVTDPGLDRVADRTPELKNWFCEISMR